jgi:hypothetical protein
MAHVILFEHANFHGQHKHVFGTENNLNASDDNFFNDKVSSMVILDGRWEFFKDSNQIAKLGPTLGPGNYPSVLTALGAGSNDQISSLRSV